MNGTENKPLYGGVYGGWLEAFELEAENCEVRGIKETDCVYDGKVNSAYQLRPDLKVKDLVRVYFVKVREAPKEIPLPPIYEHQPPYVPQEQSVPQQQQQQADIPAHLQTVKLTGDPGGVNTGKNPTHGRESK